MTRPDNTENKGPQVWEGTVPLLLVPDSYVRRFAKAFVQIGNSRLKRYVFGVVLQGGGVMQGEVQLTNGNGDMIKRWLRSLPKPGRGVLDEIESYLQQIDIGMPALVTDAARGRVEFGVNVLFTAPNDKAVLSYMMASILKAGFGKNIRCCPQCAKTNHKPGPWFIDFPKGRSIKKYCTPAHQNAFAQAKDRAKKRGAK